MKTFVIGDIHGTYKSLSDCLKLSAFDDNNDQLICLGDVADGYPEVYECFERLFTIKNLIYVFGNHDYWLYEYLKFGYTPYIWTSQGGKNSIKSYFNRTDHDKQRHCDFLGAHTVYYHIDYDNRVFVHGGFNRRYDISYTSNNELMWDRSLLEEARQASETGGKKFKTKNNFKEIFIGHTTTELYDAKLLPLNFLNLWDLDTGAGWSGKLTIMNVDTKEFWQSDYSKEYYPGHINR